MNRALRFGLVAVLVFAAIPLFAQQNVPPRAKAFETAPDLPYDSVPNFLKLPQNLYLGEGIGVARNSKWHVFVFTRSGETRLFELDQNANYVREIGQALYGFQMAHEVRVDSQHNNCAVGDATNMFIKVRPEGR